MSKRHPSFAVNPRALALGVALLSLVYASCAAPSSSSSSGGAAASDSALPPVVAVVNGREIPTRLYEMYLKNGRGALAVNEATEEGRRKLEILREGIVSDLIDRTLIAAEAEQRGLSIPPATLEEAERGEVAELGGEEKFKAYLADHHMTREQYLDVVKAPLYGELLRADLGKGISVSDEEIKAFYDAHKGEEAFRVPERVSASHILINARPNVIAQELRQGDQGLVTSTRDVMAVRRARAEGVRRKAVAKGADFAALAREFSEDLGTREAGGDLGSFVRGSHPRAFDAATFALKPGEVSGVVQTDFGFHIIKVKSHDAARTLTLEEATPQIRKQLFGEREARTLRDWLKDARSKAKVRINEPFRFGALKNEFPAT